MKQPDKSTTWNPRDYNVICDICGKKRKRSECTMAFWTGDEAIVMSCLDGCADYRHPLNSPPPIIFDGQPVPDPRPDVYGNNITYTPTAVNSIYSWGYFIPPSTWANIANAQLQGGINQSYFTTSVAMLWGSFP